MQRKKDHPPGQQPGNVVVHFCIKLICSTAVLSGVESKNALKKTTVDCLPCPTQSKKPDIKRS